MISIHNINVDPVKCKKHECRYFDGIKNCTRSCVLYDSETNKCESFTSYKGGLIPKMKMINIYEFKCFLCKQKENYIKNILETKDKDFDWFMSMCEGYFKLEKNLELINRLIEEK